MEDNFKKFCEYKVGYKYSNLFMKEKLPIASNNNPHELLYQRSLMFVDLRKVGYLVDKLWFNFILFI